ncbi:phosphopyruvate hydratase [Candidatus Berkelbacteria bacterium RIFCSPHIGHO2_12_FULL_36_9]|uniref:Enolase n=1 Tax=Candidatus Berkelbacteria bacterium RIFCSPHIGHO2_12_FULL_36_9 TaxID=1797469 RepID=A0A1F5EG80_9BACT|nr:MAG: phosphopyruvate hydratase [Candidatus Berkelbacteria bacterium RIFCSPHIGHO2_12_FULL_36_9]
MGKIKSIFGREILDSRSDSTLEVDVILDDGSSGRASIPSGASTGRNEAFKITDISKALNNVDVLAKNLIGQEADQEKIDLLMINSDATPNKENLGGNVILAISLGVCEAAAKSANLPLYQYIRQISKIDTSGYKLPTPLFNIINGGKHADNNLPFQEFMIIPTADGSFKDKYLIGSKVYHQLKKDLAKLGLSTAVGDEGGFAPKLNSNDEALELLVASIQNTGFTPREQVSIGLDVAASSINDLNSVTYPDKPSDYYQKIVDKYPITLIEDPLGEDDWQGWVELNQKLGSRIRVVGDDIFTTNPNRLQMGIEKKAANSIIIKPDQIGTLTEAFRTIHLALNAGFDLVVSHRSGETESTFIADLAVGIGAKYIKTGAPARGERTAKYNQLLRIEENL